MGWAERSGRWFDRLFMEKATSKELSERISGLGTAIHQDLEAVQERLLCVERSIQSILVRINTNDESILKIRDDINSVKAIMRIGGSRPQANLKSTDLPPQTFDGSKPWMR